jgi:quercetin dioxygenase-like cupin family protein
MEIRRFGVGNRRPDGPPGTTGVAGQVIHADARGTVSELAFARRASVEPHASPNTTWFIVIEGGGMVRVGDERARVAAGEAVLWPADVPHAAWTELSEMRAIVVELAGPDDAHLRGILDGRALAIGAGAAGAGASDAPAEKADGELSTSPADAARSAIEGEPL